MLQMSGSKASDRYARAITRILGCPECGYTTDKLTDHAHSEIHGGWYARNRLRSPIYTGEGIPENPRRCRRPGAVEACLALLGEVRAAGSWKRYAAEPRVQLVVLRKLVESGRAVATRGVLTLSLIHI